MEAREAAAIKAANDYLNITNGLVNMPLSERLVRNPKACVEELITTSRRLLNPSGGLVDRVDQACCPSTFNKGKELEWQTTTSLPQAILASCKGNWKYADEFNFGESNLGSTKLSHLKCRLPLCGRDFAVTTRQRPSKMDSQQFPLTSGIILIKKSCKSGDMSPIQMRTRHVTSIGKEVGIHDPDLPVSRSKSCAGRLTRLSRGPACLEDGMKQLSTRDLFLALEIPRKVCASLFYLSADQLDNSCEGRRTCRPQHHHSLGKCSMSPTAIEFKRCPAWMSSLNVRKPSKGPSMSITHTRLQATTASLKNGVAVVKELEELALCCNQPKDSILAGDVKNDLKERGQEDLDCRAANASTPNHNRVTDHCKRRQAGLYFRAPAYTKIIGSTKGDAPVSKSIVHGAAEIATNGLSNGIFLPWVLTAQENPRVTSCFVAQKDSRFDDLPTNQFTFLFGLDCLILEVVHAWVDGCLTSYPCESATSGSLNAISPVTTLFNHRGRHRTLGASQLEYPEREGLVDVESRVQ